MVQVLEPQSNGSSSDSQQDRMDCARRLVCALARRRAAGEVVSEDSLSAAHPELMPELAEELEKLRRIGRALEQVESAESDVAPADLDAVADDAFTEEIPETIGRYRVRQVLGEGAFGCVYLGWDEELRREVAIKVPHPHHVAGPHDVAAYLAEARIVAGLDHPSIVPVYDVGRTDDGCCYVVSKRIRGSDLQSRIRDERIRQDEAARIATAVADALDHAHAHGLVHRDVKPGNILLDPDGRAYVTDFGLALARGDFGRGRAMAGTPAYMSPEQARGEAHRVDGRSDVFSLGVVLYEMLTGRKPFSADTHEELLRQVIWAEPRPPRQCDGSIDEELERICLKALSKRATDRYTSARELADDLRHFLGAAGQRRPASAIKRGQPAAASTPGDVDRSPMIVPKGLRPFDAADADAFLPLVPGPRDREGVPESIRQWKARVEPQDAEDAFAVGVLYGPSGCGKSSLVRAGLMPRLSAQVHPIYIEATGDDTESRILQKLRRTWPDLPQDGGLVESLAAVRRGSGPAAGEKVLLVLDQFEQWLHGRGEHDRRVLVEALRQCDGGRLQCLLLVRDDFWLALSRFMTELEIDLVQRHNTGLVDLFDPAHARKVLAEFGRAFGTLPEDLSLLRPAQATFLDRAIEGLSDGDKVVPVRLALFAEMVKGKPWTPATLRDVGGAGGVGVAFLEDTFNARTANPQHRRHQQAAQAVLAALMPEPGSDMKGSIRSYIELLDLSGYGAKPREFKELMRILDAETRLITPTDPGVLGPRQSDLRPQRYFQLTHDYLVPALRQWLTKKQKSTRAGRNELRLAERASLWNARPERRQLPSVAEWVGIAIWTRSALWTPAQRKMMRAAVRHYAVLATFAVALVLLILSAGLEALGTARDLLAQFRARSAAVWLVAGQDQAVWPLLKHGPDPTLRTRVIHGVSPLVIDAETLLTRLEGQEDVSIRRAMLLMAGKLAGQPADELGARADLRRSTPPEALLQRLEELYRDDPDPGIHAAAEWALRRFGQQDRIARCDQQLASSAPRDDALWYVNRQGHTMVIIPGPAEFLMGSSATSDERPHRQRIRRSFTVASKETTAEQFQSFLNANRAVDRGPAESPVGPSRPRTSLTWYEAAAYCNWLSQLESLPEDHWCYVPNDAGQYAAGMKLAADFLDRRGYRLPTEGEWEYACRAGAAATRYFGEDSRYLLHFAVFLSADDRPGSVGARMPNDLGLFDMLGNAAEWCHDRYRADLDRGPPPEIDVGVEMGENDHRVVRGGSFRDPAEQLRSAARAHHRPQDRLDTLGFRVARGYP